MTALYAVEVEPEVRTWLEHLSDRDFGRADFLVGLLAEQTETLGEPYSRHLGGQARELRFHLLARQPRITCLARARQPDHPADSVPENQKRRDSRGRSCLTSPESLRSRTRPAHDTFNREAS